MPNAFPKAFVYITGDKVSAPTRHPPDAPQPVRMIYPNLPENLPIGKHIKGAGVLMLIGVNFRKRYDWYW